MDRTAVTYPTTWLNLMNCGENGRSHPITWLNLMNCGENGRFHPIPWLNLMNYGQNGRYSVPLNENDYGPGHNSVGVSKQIGSLPFLNVL